jgi:hypothetical protein
VLLSIFLILANIQDCVCELWLSRLQYHAVFYVVISIPEKLIHTDDGSDKIL